jgi:hypothetical protein
VYGKHEPKGRNYIFEELYTWFVKSQYWYRLLLDV